MPENKRIRKGAKSFLKERKAQRLQSIMKKEIRQQVAVKNLAESMLKEGVWDRIKGAGSAVMNKMGMQGPDVMGQGEYAQKREQKVQKVSQAIDSALKKAGQERQKFNSQILKSAQMMNSYHSSVMRAFALYKRFEDTLGPAGMQINRQINDVLEGLEQDLMSEISQIESMLKSVGKKDQSLDKRMEAHKEQAMVKREREADASARMGSSFGRTQEKMPSKVRMGGASHEDSSSLGGDEISSEQRVGAMDKKGSRDMDSQLAEIESVYQEQSKDLTQRAISGSKEEKKAAMRQLMDIVKAKKAREKEIRNKFSYTR